MVENPCQVGTLGETAVCKELVKLGYDVFAGLGSHSKVDLIVLDESYKAFKIQVKAIKSKNECVAVYSVKTCLNPRYNSTYSTTQVDVFAVYVVDRDLVFYLTAKELLKNGKVSKFRLSEARNGQHKNVRYVKDYLSFRKALRDCTPHAQTELAVGEEPVQTTTPEMSAASES